MWACRTTRRADVADGLQALHFVPDLDAGNVAREVRVAGFDAVRVHDLQQVTGGAARPDVAHRARRRSADGCTQRRPDIGAEVRHDLVQDRMHAPGIEGRGDGGARDWFAPATFVRALTG